MLRLVSNLSRVRQGVCNIKQLQKVQQCLLSAKSDPAEEHATAVAEEAAATTTEKEPTSDKPHRGDRDGGQHERRPRRNDRREGQT